MDDLTDREREALKHVPQTLGGPPRDEEAIAGLVAKGYAEQGLGGLVLTTKGQLAQALQPRL